MTFRFHSKIFIKLEIRVSQNLSRKSGGRPVKCQGWEGRPFPSSPGPLFQNEVKYSAFDIPLWLLFDMEMIFHSHANKTHFLKRGCALSLNLKVRAFWNSEVAYWELRCTQGSSTSFLGSLSCPIGYLFLDFLPTVRLGNPKKDLKNCQLKKNGLAYASIISKNKTAVHENSFCKFFFGFPNRTVKGKSQEIHEIRI